MRQKANGSSAEALARWIARGGLRYCVDAVEGLENAPESLVGHFEGTNTGKPVVKI